ncbi:MAG TPA: hypothetical protein VK446_00365 [Methylocystis sp.]|nr:hypothetical protein [Methylocystis sp.]
MINRQNWTSSGRVLRYPVVLGFALLASAGPGLCASAQTPAASPRGAGLSAACSLVASGSGTLECNFPVLPPDKGLEIQYVSAECTANAGVSSEVAAFQILTVPPNSNVAVPYNVPIASGQNAFVGSPTAVWTAGKSVKLFAKAGTSPVGLIYMGYFATHTPGLVCTVSISGVTF